MPSPSPQPRRSTPLQARRRTPADVPPRGPDAAGPEARPAPRLRYMPAMDGLRGLMLLVVIAVHAGYVLKPQRILPDGSAEWGGYFPGGFIVMDVFFVQSGFLITALLLSEKVRTGTVSFANFYLRRACRLLPAVFVMMGAHFVYNLISGQYPFGIEARALFAIGFYFANIYQAWPEVIPFAEQFPNELAHMWSLSLEEQFYLLWPIGFAVIMRLRRSTRSVPTVLWLCIAAAALMRVAVWETQGYPAAYMLLWAHSDGIFMGCALAFLWRDGRLPKRYVPQAAWVALIAIFGWVFLYNPDNPDLAYRGGFTVFSALSVVLVVATAHTDWSANRFFATKVMRTLGKTSYGTYLWHLPVIEITHRSMGQAEPWQVVAVALPLTALISAASWRFVEQPFLRLKNSRFEGNSRVEAPAGAGAGANPATRAPAPTVNPARGA